MFGRHITLALAVGTTALAIEAVAVETNNDLLDSSFALSIESPRQDSFIFRERFDYAFDHSVNGIFSDELHPLKIIKWNMDLPGTDFSDHLHEQYSKQARSAFTKSIEYSIREAAVEAPFMFWLDEHHGTFADILRGTLGNTQEEEVSALDLSYRSAEQSWWKNMLNNGGTHYGIRPFRTSPYVYVSHDIRDGGNNTVFAANLRYYYDHFTQHRFELSLAVPLAYGMVLDLGSAYEFGTHDEQRLVVKLLKELKGGGIMHLGLEVKEHPQVIAGISFAW